MTNEVSNAIVAILKANNVTPEEMNLISEQVVGQPESKTEYTFTQEQLLDYTEGIMEITIQGCKDDIRYAVEEIELNDFVDLELDGDRICVNLNETQVTDEIIEWVGNERYNTHDMKSIIDTSIEFVFKK
jgi:hypothetical protein